METVLNMLREVKKDMNKDRKMMYEGNKKIIDVMERNQKEILGKK